MNALTFVRYAAWAALAGAFYVVSVTLLVPRLGVGPTILFAVSAQMLTSALIDHFGLLACRFARSVRLERSAWRC